ncbi:MAG TPA: sigma factor-like helix-turn-helix DNA-binding protein [Candidatus Paceibacterota bacterium]|nr:sigma factor-like helix-turn-helix DNA-binding protein [Candidatus Paceibacterota bacterium]
MPGKATKSAISTKSRTAVKPSFDSTTLVKKLLGEVSERAREVLTLRFGLGTKSERETLEAIGERWGITRERVRQIEAAAIEAVRASKGFKDAKPAFDELCAYVESQGAILPEDHLLSGLASDEKAKNRFRFLLVVGSAFFRERETDEFYARWHVNHATAKKVHAALSGLYSSLSDTEVLSESEVFERFLTELKDVDVAYRNEEILKRWLALAKNIDSNPLAEWGRSDAPAIRTKGIRDYAYLVIKREGTPMHFRDVANAIASLFAKKAHVATTHNELMKDERFVLVGRGLYALAEWGYKPGVVRDVIREILRKFGPLSRERVLEEVKKVRYVKDNTILVNLNDPKHFKRSKSGTYALA